MVPFGRLVAVLLVVGCQQHVPDAPPAIAPVAPAPPTRIWDLAGTEPFAVVGDSLLAYDRERDGIVDIATATGSVTRFRKIANTPASGTPGMWVPVDGGAIVSWDERIVFIRDDGALSFGWMVGHNSWYSGIGGGDVAWLGKARDEAGLYAINVKDGSTRWSARFPDDIQGFEMGGDATTILTSHQEYQHMPPGDHDIFHVFAAYDGATGKQRWHVLLPFEPTAVAIGVGGAVAVSDDAIRLFDGTTGALHVVKLAKRTSPHVLVDRGLALIVDDDTNTLAAYSLHDGSLAWRVTEPVDPAVGMIAMSAGIATHGSLVFVARHGVVYAFERSTGKLAWTVHTAWSSDRIVVTDTAIVAMDSHGASGFALPAAAPPLEMAYVHGVVRSVRCATMSSLSVRIGDTRAHPDAQGRFSATIRAAGRIEVEVPYNRREDADTVTSQVLIPLTGAGDYATPDLAADDCPYSYE